MKKLLTIVSIFCAVAATSCTDYETQINRVDQKVDDLEVRVTALEELCRTMNTNISALQDIVEALQKNDYVTDVTPVIVNGSAIGYTISFTNSDPITIYHGDNGEDGDDGRDGKDGYTPQIGIREHSDGNLYWTLDGEWMRDNNGNMVKAVGIDGEDGQNGEDGANGKDGANGENGKDGKDGITPELKIENDYWYISYDNGATWTMLGKATGENGADGQDGANGADGKDGKDGDSFFTSVEMDENNLYLTLADGTEISLPLASSYLFNRLQSVCFVPRYSDGMASVYTSGAISASYVEMDFEVSPKDAAAEIAEQWESILSMQAVNTITRAVSFVALPVTSCVADAETGVITVKATAENLGEEFFSGEATFSARIGISDGNTDIKSEYIPLITTEMEQPYNEIWYTATEFLGYFMYQDEYFGANIVDHVYDEETGNGIITFDRDLEILGDRALAGRGMLTSISLPNGITSIGEEAFDNNRQMVKVKLGKRVTTIGNRAFYACWSLTDINIPEGVTSIGQLAFGQCLALEHINLPNSITHIGKWAFDDCRVLKSLIIPEKITIVEEAIARNCYELAEVVIPEGVSTIGIQAFASTNLTEVTIPSTVTEIMNMAFNNCTNITTVYCKPTTPPATNWTIFDNTGVFGDKSGVIYVPAESLDKYQASEDWKRYTDKFVGYEF